MQEIDARLRGLFAEVADSSTTVDDAIAFIKDELLASFRRGRETTRRDSNRSSARKGRRLIAKR